MENDHPQPPPPPPVNHPLYELALLAVSIFFLVYIVMYP
jgi:hypothetical protein